MAQFKINVENAKLHAAIFDKAADELRKCSMEIEIIRDSLDPSLHELTPSLEALSAEVSGNAEGVSGLAEALRKIISFFEETENRILEFIKESEPIPTVEWEKVETNPNSENTEGGGPIPPIAEPGIPLEETGETDEVVNEDGDIANKMNVDIQKIYDGLTDDQKQFVDNIDKLNYSGDILLGMKYTAILLLDKGMEKEFVAGVLGNYVCEGKIGTFESSCYSDPKRKPAYLTVLDEHFDYSNTMSGKSIEEVGISKTKDYLKYINEHDNEFSAPQWNKKTQQWETKTPDLYFGIGGVQWTSDDRADGLIKLYEEICEGDFPTKEEQAKVEAIYIAYELTGHEGVVSYSSVYENWKKNKTVENAASVIYSQYEKPYDNTEEKRKTAARLIYDTLMQ